MVPRVITAWGLIGAPLFVAGTVLGLYGVGPSAIPTAAAALGLSELVLAVWLIVKGFARSDERASSAVAIG